MSGPIRRLARDAVSPTRPTIHAMARLPYMSPPPLLPIDETGTPGAGMMPGSTQAAWPATSAVPPPGAMSGQPSPVAGDASRSAIETGIAAEPGLNPSAPSRQTSSPSPSALHPSSRSPDLFPLMPASPAQGPTPGGVSPAAPAAGDETSTPATATPSSTFAPAQASAAAPAPDQPDTRSANARTQPAALLPPIVQDAHSSRSSPAAASAQRTPAAADGPTEVHVHIGRVEVTAVQAPAAPKPSARSGPQPMSLDDYLARRQRRGS